MFLTLTALIVLISGCVNFSESDPAGMDFTSKERMVTTIAGSGPSVLGSDDCLFEKVRLNLSEEL